MYWVYIMASNPRGTLYVGVTSELIKRVWQHKQGEADGFTRRYQIKQLVHFEESQDITAAIAREKQIKGWHRAWKLKLIEANNPDWRDLYDSLVGKT
ncbi:GIY-YIG nuclease family protein [Permianibacter sp. IMCC34836]|uniref:GIY-YIG nuclease family protein n=1 Tax=Permianibacter fluminis TaxID=2738515 RepID=UPI0015533005|nr:GIY-YIG nuclease family protein [Permianibacter fluminis]NQD39089.1 GIY-YIG nuclease family protein [Permianibacter fluminis]